jgi:hypothetical protein
MAADFRRTASPPLSTEPGQLNCVVLSIPPTFLFLDRLPSHWYQMLKGDDALWRRTLMMSSNR